MKHKIFYLTEFCNLKCKYCYEHNPHNNKNMDFKGFCSGMFEIYKQCTQNDEINVVLTGGEPTVNWKLIEDICDWKNRFSIPYKTNYCIVTNGTLLDEEKIKFLIKHSIQIQISYDGRTTDKYRGEGTSNKIESILEIMKKNNLYDLLTLSWCIYDENIGFLVQDIRKLTIRYPGVIRQIILLPVYDLLKIHNFEKTIEITNNDLSFINICHNLCNICKNKCNSQNEKNGYHYFLTNGSFVKTDHIGIKGKFDHF